MKYRRFQSKVVVRIDKGEEIVTSLSHLCKKLNIKSGTIIGIGATNKITIGLMNTETKKYQSKELTGDHEITPLVGNITTKDGEVYLHLHITVCNDEHQALGGHLTSAVVSATFEGVIDIIDGEITREFDTSASLNLLKL